MAEDHGVPQLSTSQVLCVQVIDVNDEAPAFQWAEFETRVMENQGPGTTVLTVTATDRDQGLINCKIVKVKVKYNTNTCKKPIHSATNENVVTA